MYFPCVNCTSYRCWQLIPKIWRESFPIDLLALCLYRHLSITLMSIHSASQGTINLYLFSFVTKVGRSQQQHMPITVGPYYLTRFVTLALEGYENTRRRPTTFGRGLTYYHLDILKFINNSG